MAETLRRAQFILRLKLVGREQSLLSYSGNLQSTEGKRMNPQELVSVATGTPRSS
jgi:hypothetical protein